MNEVKMPTGKSIYKYKDEKCYKYLQKALDDAMSYFIDFDETNYMVINIEHTLSIAHINIKGKLNETVFPFDENQTYPLQELVIAFEFKRYCN